MKKDSKKRFLGGVTFLGGDFGMNRVNQVFVPGSISGLLKSVAREWQEMAVVRYLDCETEMTYRNALTCLMEEMERGERIEVGRSIRKRLVIGLVETYQESYSDKIPTSDDVFMVSGGAKGITAECIKRLSKKYGCNFLLLGRTRLVPEDDCYKGAVTPQEIRKIVIEKSQNQKNKLNPREMESIVDKITDLREIRKNIAEIEANGSKVIYCQCDIRNQQEVIKAVKTGVNKLGKITGIIHGAGALADKLVEKKTVEDFNMVFGIKYDGLNYMMSQIEEVNLRYLVVFSSVAGFFGNVGQSDYATANEYLNLYIRQINNRNNHCKVIAMNWGAWDAGMVNPALRRAMKQRGVKLIPIETGVAYFCDEIEKDNQQRSCQVIINYSHEWGV